MKDLLKKLTPQDIHTFLFRALILLLPLNLGKHFILDWNYVRGILVDYLIPTIYFQDILIVALLIFWILDVGKSGLKTAFNKNILASRALILLQLFFLISTVASVSIPASLIYFIRLVLYVIFTFYVIYNFNKTFYFENIVYLLAIGTVILSLMGLYQWYLQGSIFENYLFLGEQPYSASTKGVAIENVLGVAKIPSYGTFRHPNVFAGFLAIILLWFFAYIQYEPKLLIPLILGVFALFFTFSKVAWLAFTLGLIFLLVKNLDRRTVLPVATTVFIVILSLSLPLLKSDYFKINPSFYRRASLLDASYSITKEHLLFGSGPNTNTLIIEKYSIPSKDLRFVQPVHNIFVLLISEVGIFTLILFLYLIYLASEKKVSLLFFVTILQFIVLGSFDHYVFTMHQIQILFWLTLGLALTYNSVDYV